MKGKKLEFDGEGNITIRDIVIDVEEYEIPEPPEIVYQDET
jgi:hypothetical protein